MGGGFLSQNDIPPGIPRVTCLAHLKLVSVPKNIDFLIAFQDGGEVDGLNTLYVSGTFEFLGSCVRSVLGQTSCNQIEANGAPCWGTCGICECPYATWVSAGDITHWSTMGAQLFISTTNDAMVFDYCVDGTRLILRREWIEYEFEQTNAGGNPLPCGLRNATNCELGTGCHPGVCTGAGDCANYSNELLCVTRQCTWQASGCGGSAPKDCTVADYGKVPGCDFIPPNATCQGSRKSCAEQPLADCGSVEGCSTSGSCNGPEWDCQSFCTLDLGCYESGGCFGVGSCQRAKDFAHCYANFGCSWTTRCSGTMPPCSTYGVHDCLLHEGCSLKSPP